MTAGGDGAGATGTPGAETGGDSAADDHGRMWRSTVDVLTVVGPIAVLTGLLYYFGYVSAKAFYSYFGVSLSVLDFSTTNYVVRSADTLFRPIATVLVIMMVVFVAHHLIGRGLSRLGSGWSRRVAVGVGVAGSALAAAGLLGLYGVVSGVVSAISLGLSAILMEYGVWMASRYGEPTPRLREMLRAGMGLRRGLLASVVLVASFWAVTDLAQERGRATALVFERSLPLQAQAVVYSETDLLIPGPGVGVTTVGDGRDGYRFRYNGLRQLLYANDRWFLLPVGWTHDNGATAIVLEDAHAGSRVDLAP